MEDIFLASVKGQLHLYKSLAEKALVQMPDDKLFWAPTPDSNSVGTIMAHLWGNMLSRWTDFLTTNGEKPWRDRDAEFEEGASDREFLLRRWEEGWECCFKALDQLQPADLQRVVVIRHEAMTVVEAINRQLAHYPYHVGQLVYLARLHAPHEWQSLSIPRKKKKNKLEL